MSLQQWRALCDSLEDHANDLRSQSTLGSEAIPGRWKCLYCNMDEFQEVDKHLHIGYKAEKRHRHCREDGNTTAETLMQRGSRRGTGEIQDRHRRRAGEVQELHRRGPRDAQNRSRRFRRGQESPRRGSREAQEMLRSGPGEAQRPQSSPEEAGQVQGGGPSWAGVGPRSGTSRRATCCITWSTTSTT